MFCPCSDNSKSNSLYKINHENESKIDVRCTGYNAANLKHWKPNLFKCTKCSLIFSEYIGVDFENSYSYVVDKTYLEQTNNCINYVIDNLRNINLLSIQ